MSNRSGSDEPRSTHREGRPKKRPEPSLSPPPAFLDNRSNSHESKAKKPAPAVNSPSLEGGIVSVDVGLSCGLKPGDRVEVLWDVHFEDRGENGDGEEDVSKDAANDAAPNVDPKESDEDKAADAEADGANDLGESKKVMRWWGATLLMHDGRAHVLSDEDGGNAGAPVSAALRVLDYDPFLEGGFPHRSLEEVVFISDRSILNVSSGTRAHWRREGDSWEPGPEEEIDEDGRTFAVDTDGTKPGESPNTDAISLPNPAENLRAILNNVLNSALEKTSGAARMKSMSAAQRAVIAEKIARTKEVLLEKMMALPESQGENGGMITAEHVHRCMAEMNRQM
uniref:Uncharacterized protein n=1 Tax=Odontella aurita TaxID=265563 RepID=A0A7S4IRY5_9STRA|mmetsp:Transcript_29440/g.87275  ORF Transcript_29440/g.87275 Transcript_29440/m.87275 type:complete len:339 (+) Transcript_29440:65-1081(+)